MPDPGSAEALFLQVCEAEGDLKLSAEEKEKLVFQRGKGCEQCGNSGYRGRMTINEVMPLSPELQEAIVHRASGREIAQIATGEGMLTMRQDGLLKAIQGVTTLSEIMRVAQSGV